MGLRRVFGLVEHGEIVAIGDDLHQVVAQASGPVTVMDGAEPNPPGGKPDVKLAMRLANLPTEDTVGGRRLPLEAAVDALSIDEAFRILKGFGIKGTAASVMARSFLKSNAKLAKRLDAATAKKLDKAHPSVARARDSALARLSAQGFDDGICKGVVLLPYNFANTSLGMKLPMTKLGLCAGSSQACRDSCLAFAGKNTAINESTGDSNLVPKAKQLKALYEAPAAYLRMLIESIYAHERACAKMNARPYVRLNVLSDLPWEAWTPWLFSKFKSARFYDYTKVQDRTPPKNYDLTLSFSGKNEDACRQYLRNGGRIAVVFVHGYTTKFSAPRSAMLPGEAHADDATPADRKLAKPLPAKFWGAPVIDGDGSDIRPLDPGGRVIGLRWKIFLGRGLTFDDNGEQKTNSAVLQRSLKSRFVYPWYMDEESGCVVGPELPGMHNTEDPGDM